MFFTSTRGSDKYVNCADIPVTNFLWLLRTHKSTECVNTAERMNYWLNIISNESISHRRREFCQQVLFKHTYRHNLSQWIRNQANVFCDPLPWVSLNNNQSIPSLLLNHIRRRAEPRLSWPWVWDPDGSWWVWVQICISGMEQEVCVGVQRNLRHVVQLWSLFYVHAHTHILYIVT